MGSLSLVCPMCCGETFNNSQSLKYHLLSMTDNLYCPSCSQRSDSVTALIQHLDKCERDLECKTKSDILMDRLRKTSKEPETKIDILMVGRQKSEINRCTINIQLQLYKRYHYYEFLSCIKYYLMLRSFLTSLKN